MIILCIISKVQLWLDWSSGMATCVAFSEVLPLHFPPFILLRQIYWIVSSFRSRFVTMRKSKAPRNTIQGVWKSQEPMGRCWANMSKRIYSMLSKICRNVNSYQRKGEQIKTAYKIKYLYFYFHWFLNLFWTPCTFFIFWNKSKAILGHVHN